MRRYNSKRKLFFSVLVLSFVCLSLGYAALTNNLSVGDRVTYGSMKWDVKFTSVVDVKEQYSLYAKSKLNEDIYVVDSNPSLVSGGEDIAVSFDFGNSTNEKYSVVKATITNNGSFDVVYNDLSLLFKSNDEREFFMPYIKETNVYWFSSFEEPLVGLKKGDVLKVGETKELLFVGTLAELTEDLLPENGFSVKLNYHVEWVESSSVTN